MQKISSSESQQVVTTEQTKHTTARNEPNEGTKTDALEDKTKQQTNTKTQETQPYEKLVNKTGIGGVFNTKG